MKHFLWFLKYVGLYRFNGVPSHKFKYQKQFGSKNNTYILHVTQSEPYKPLRYEMLGYDHLLRSHYDHYIIDYLAFESWKFDYKILQVPIGWIMVFVTLVLKLTISAQCCISYRNQSFVLQC